MREEFTKMLSNLDLLVLSDKHKDKLVKMKDHREFCKFIQAMVAITDINWLYERLCRGDNDTFVHLLTLKLNKDDNIYPSRVLDHLPHVLNQRELEFIIEKMQTELFKSFIKGSFVFMSTLGHNNLLKCIYAYIDEDLLMTPINENVYYITMLRLEFKDELHNMIDSLDLDWDKVLDLLE